MIDLGSGWGTLLFALAKEYPERQLIGYELSFLPYAYSRIYKTIFRLHHVTIYRQDFLHADFSHTARPSTALMVCYLFPAGMRKLQQKLTRQQQHHCLLISSTFALPDTKPSQSIQLDDIYHTPIYLYTLKKTEQHVQPIHEH